MATNVPTPHHDSLSVKMPLGKLENAARMRAEPTRAELAFWGMLRAASKEGRWRRQVPMLGYIADFYCPELRLIVEIDGGYHRARSAEDAARDERFWAKAKIRTIRFKNWEIEENAARAVAFVMGQAKNRRKVEAKAKREPDECLIIVKDRAW